MDFISALIAAYLALLWMVAMYFVERRPVSTRIKCKYRVADDSILRKIIPFKDRPNMPCIYFKIVPIYIYLRFAQLHAPMAYCRLLVVGCWLLVVGYKLLGVVADFPIREKIHDLY